jgi:hypothetical protein
MSVRARIAPVRVAVVKKSDVQYRPDDDGLAPRSSGDLKVIAAQLASNAM